jgi:hypothetical protein
VDVGTLMPQVRAGVRTSTGAKGMADETGVGVYLGLDVGKGEHHATAVNLAGKKVFDKPLPNNEPKLRSSSTNSGPSTERCGSSLTSQLPSRPCPWQSPGMRAARSPICLV